MNLDSIQYVVSSSKSLRGYNLRNSPQPYNLHTSPPAPCPTYFAVLRYICICTNNPRHRCKLNTYVMFLFGNYTTAMIMSEVALAVIVVKAVFWYVHSLQYRDVSNLKRHTITWNSRESERFVNFTRRICMYVQQCRATHFERPLMIYSRRDNECHICV